ncbi:MAG: hypothetical protein A4E57_03317 [Syntrophorhabdaceae bacterium PtaU1.Bin034]|jgi:hypothetical protein|nr:MAG: hypothetical protein A4E57_03317 [Syntrophorhabdaceae bacterium PtaU1.Bin034]
MEHIEYPSRQTWEQRREWFESVEEKARGDGSYIVSEQACALTADVQSAFCAGAWIGVIILSMAVVDAALRETEVPGFTGNIKKLLEAANANPRLHAMRERRNALVHVNPDNPALTVDQQWTERDKLEEQAKEAVELMFEAFYIGPWV